MRGDDLIDVMPLVQKWEREIKATEARIDALPWWRWIKRVSLREKMRVYEQALGMISLAALRTSRERRA
jgi:hypothetical protein